jgi:hypothetical protein
MGIPSLFTIYIAYLRLPDQYAFSAITSCLSSKWCSDCILKNSFDIDVRS